VAADKQPLMGQVDGHSSGFLTGWKGRGIEHLVFLRIKLEELRFVFNVDPDMACAIGCCGFRLATQRDRASHFSRLRVHSRSIVAAGVEHEDVLRRGIVEETIRAVRCQQFYFVNRASVFRSKMVTELERPLLENPRPNSFTICAP